MIIRYPCAKFHRDTPTNNEDTWDGGRAVSASPELIDIIKAQSDYC